MLAPKDDWTEPNSAELAKCGANFKVVQTSDNGGEEEEGVPKHQVYMLAGIYLVFAIIGPTIIFFLLDPLSKYGEDERKEQKVWNCQTRIHRCDKPVKTRAMKNCKYEKIQLRPLTNKTLNRIQCKPVLSRTMVKLDMRIIALENFLSYNWDFLLDVY